MGRLYLIPDPARPEASRALAARFDACFEYNDFYDPRLLDDAAAVRERVMLYRSLDRDTSRDTVHGAFLDVTVHSDDPQIRAVSRQRVLGSMEAAAALGACGVVFHPGAVPVFFSAAYDEQWLAANREFFTLVCARYPDINVYMENMFDARPDLLLALATEMRGVPNFGLCLDYSHAALFGGDPAEWMRKLAPFVRHMHINDHDGRADLHLACGDGVTDWRAFDRAVREANVDPSVLIETKDLARWERSCEFLRTNGFFPFGNGVPPC